MMEPIIVEPNCRCLDILFKIKEEIPGEIFWISELKLGKTKEIPKFTPDDFLDLSQRHKNDEKIIIVEGPLEFSQKNSRELCDNQFCLFENGFVRSFQLKIEGKPSTVGGFPLMLEEYFLLSLKISIDTRHLNTVEKIIESFDIFQLREIDKFNLNQYDENFCEYLRSGVTEYSFTQLADIDSKFDSISHAVEKFFFHLGTNTFLKKGSEEEIKIKKLIYAFADKIYNQLRKILDTPNGVSPKNLNTVGQILMMLNMLKYNQYRINCDPEKENIDPETENNNNLELIPEETLGEIINILNIKNEKGNGLEYLQYNQLMHHAYLRALIEGENYNYRRGKEILHKHSLRAAVAAIIGRNMSHNIGSHVLSYLSDQDCTEEFIKDFPKSHPKCDKFFDRVGKIRKVKDRLYSNFLGHLRERMDLVAAIPTHDPIWSLSINIKQELCNNLTVQYKEIDDSEIPIQELFFLVDNLVRSEEIRAKDIEFVVQFPETSEEQEVTLYGGVLGIQCFYVILENFIRNSAKHGLKGSLGEDGLKIYIDFYSKSNETIKFPEEEYVLVEMYDNLGGWPKTREYYDANSGDTKKVSVDAKDEIFPKLNPKKGGALIDDVGRLNTGSWGLKEMRIAASYMRGIPVGDIDKYNCESDDSQNFTTKDVIKPFQVNKDGFKTHSLGYRFLLKKTKSVLIISDDENIRGLFPTENETEEAKEKLIEELEAEGIGIVGRSDIDDELSLFSHEYFILDLRGENTGILELFKEKCLLFPMKTFFLYDGDPNSLVNSLKEYFRGEKLIEKLIVKINELLNHYWIKELVYNSNLKDKQSIVNLYNQLNFMKKFKLNIRAKWNCILFQKSMNDSNNHFNMNAEIYVNSEKRQHLEGCDYYLSLLHPPLSNYWKSSKDIKKNNFLALYSSKHHYFFAASRSALINLETKIDIKELGIILKLFEISLYNFVIIDERLYEYQKKFKSIAKQNNIKVGKFWHFQNVIFLNLRKERNEKTKILYYPFDWQQTWSENQCPEEETNSKELECNNIDALFPKWFDGRVHIMVVHISIIDKIGGKESFEEWLSSLGKRFRPWFLLIDSGRGHPEVNNFPESARFVDFSSLRKFIIEEPDKHILANVLLSARK